MPLVDRVAVFSLCHLNPVVAVLFDPLSTVLCLRRTGRRSGTGDGHRHRNGHGRGKRRARAREEGEREGAGRGPRNGHCAVCDTTVFLCTLPAWCATFGWLPIFCCATRTFLSATFNFCFYDVQLLVNFKQCIEVARLNLVPKNSTTGLPVALEGYHTTLLAPFYLG